METIRLSDWSGFTDYGGSKEVYAPATEAEVVSLVRYCLERQKKLRVVGLRTSWNTLWYCEDVMMTTSRLNAIRAINTVARTTICEPGVRLSELHSSLWENGLTLTGSPGVDWVTVGGAVSTGSHGSGSTSISSKLIKCRLVTGTGEVIEIDDSEPDQLDAVRISLGLTGVLTSVTLSAVDALVVTVKQTRIPTADWRRFLKEGQMSYLLWFPHTEYSVLVTATVQGRARDQASSNRAGMQSAGDSAPAVFDSRKTVRAVQELANVAPSTSLARNRYLLDVVFNDFERTGPAHEMVMSFTTDPIAGAEWALPIPRFEEAFEELQQLAESRRFYLPIVWLKKVDPETAWLAAADEPSIHCGMYQDVIPGSPSHVEETVRFLERLMMRYRGRPHLGKLVYLEPSALKQAYPNWSRFDAFRRRLDPQGVFWSKAIEARFGAPTEPANY